MDEIVVCVKQVPDPDLVQFDLNKGQVNNIFYILNPHDRGAVEEALRVKERAGGLTVTVLTLGTPQADNVLRTCLTMGADKAIRVWNSSFTELDPYQTSVILAKAIETLPYKIIFFGALSVDQQNGYLGAAVAEALHLPQVTGIIKFEPSSAMKDVTVQRRVGKGEREVVRCSLPAVFTVDQEINEPRYPSLPVVLSGLRKKINLIDPQSLGINTRALEPTVNVLEQTPSRPRTKRGMANKIARLPTHQRLKAIMTGGMQNKESGLISGPPQESAVKLLNFILERNIMRPEK